jgi:hypothetical protein
VVSKPRPVTLTGTAFNCRRRRLESAPSLLEAALQLDPGHGLPLTRGVVVIESRDGLPLAKTFWALIAAGGGRVEVSGMLRPAKNGFTSAMTLSALRLLPDP